MLLPEGQRPPRMIEGTTIYPKGYRCTTPLRIVLLDACLVNLGIYDNVLVDNSIQIFSNFFVTVFPDTLEQGLAVDTMKSYQHHSHAALRVCVGAVSFCVGLRMLSPHGR